MTSLVEERKEFRAPEDREFRVKIDGIPCAFEVDQGETIVLEWTGNRGAK